MAVIATQLLHLRIKVENMQEALRFFSDLLGLKVVRRESSPLGRSLVFLRCGAEAVELELCQADDAPFVPLREDQVHLALRVESIEDARRRLAIHGYPLLEEPLRHGGEYIAFIAGPGGCEIELIERI